ncbi:hypothetical protein [Tranquillimonas rosea]|uniref:hypothetical protein n=1 Tax=Tranquillimonas rosea TaxID=641238 RepID=UPI003BAA2AF3
MIALARACLACIALGTGWANWTVLATHPFAQPFVERGSHEIDLAVDAALARQVDADWIARRLERELSEADLEGARQTAALARQRDLPIAPEQAAALDALERAETGLAACAGCAADPATCPDLDLVLKCNLPVELTPLGDIGALARAGRDWATGDEIDRVDVALATAGLSASALALVSGGSSLTVKAGSATLRTARRARALSRPMEAYLARTLPALLHLDALPRVATGRAPAEALIDTARAATLGRMADDVVRLAGNTSRADALALMRYADGPDDVARLARVSDAVGEGTRPALHALGKARVFRLMTRLSDLALLAIGLIGLLLAQLLSLVLFALRRALPKPARRRPRRRIEPTVRPGGQPAPPRP